MSVTQTGCVCVYCIVAAKSQSALLRLSEDEAGVIDLSTVQSSMQAAISGLASEYTHTVIARITPGTHTHTVIARITPGKHTYTHTVTVTVCTCVATLDRVMVEVEGERYPLKQIAQLGMPNPSLIVINLSSYPQVNSHTHTHHLRVICPPPPPRPPLFNRTDRTPPP